MLVSEMSPCTHIYVHVCVYVYVCMYVHIILDVFMFPSLKSIHVGFLTKKQYTHVYTRLTSVVHEYHCAPHTHTHIHTQTHTHTNMNTHEV